MSRPTSGRPSTAKSVAVIVPKLSGFVFTEKLGSGTYAVVYKAYRKVQVFSYSHDFIKVKVSSYDIMTYHQIYLSAKTVTLIESNLVKYAKIFTSVIYISIIYANKMDLNFCIRYRFLKKLASNISLYLSTAAVL